MDTSLNTRRIALPLMALAVTALSVSSAAADGPKYDLFQRVQEQVLRYSFFTVFDNVNVEIAGEGHVVLTGDVTGGHKAKAIAKRVPASKALTISRSSLVGCAIIMTRAHDIRETKASPDLSQLK